MRESPVIRALVVPSRGAVGWCALLEGIVPATALEVTQDLVDDGRFGDHGYHAHLDLKRRPFSALSICDQWLLKSLLHGSNCPRP